MIKKDSSNFVSGKFYYKGIPLEDGPEWGMTLRSAGSMRFRWNEENPVRDSFLASLSRGGYKIAAVELIHSRSVIDVHDVGKLSNIQADGMITSDKTIIPVVTVADCMPIYLYDHVKKVFGMLHSGWKGTGIVREAIEIASAIYGCDPEDFCVVMGPHIHSCCYRVNEERSSYFRVNFSPDCVHLLDAEKGDWCYSLSLADANLSILHSLGIPDSSILVSKDCTCCNPVFGSFRRETLGLPKNMSLEEKQKHFTVQAAWVKF